MNSWTTIKELFYSLYVKFVNQNLIHIHKIGAKFVSQNLTRDKKVPVKIVNWLNIC
jgi:predicted RNA-binding protein with RPS1 domain